jgi:penicillin-binding protein 1A
MAKFNANKVKNKIKGKTTNIKNSAKRKWGGNLKTLIVIMFYTLGIVIAATVLIFGLYIIITAPDFNTQELYKKEATVLLDTDGNEITRLGDENRVLVTYDDLPQTLVDALVATEDSRFFQHNGFDAARFIKASFGQVLGNSGAGGASTLTMQLVKNTYTSNEASGIKGIIRKFTDIYMAVFKIEKTYTKEEIIEFYVNSQWLGKGTINYQGVYGVEQASQDYFGKSVKDLSLAESALLVGMFNNPTSFNPYNYPENAAKRQSVVLGLMVKHGYITEEEKEAAESIPIESLLVENDDSYTNPYQAFIDYVVDNVKENTGDDPYSVPMRIQTTMDRSIQDVVNDVTNGTGGYTFVDDKVQMGMAITSTTDGSVVAISGGRNYQAAGLNRATDIKRQPGSTAKPIFDYGPYIEYENGSTKTYFFDEPYTYSSGGSVKNYDNKYKGLITMTDALVDSRNIPALQAFQAVDNDKIADFAHNLGIDYGDGLYESCSIGGFDGVNPLQMSAAYAAFGRGGYYIAPYGYTEITYLDTDETVKYSYDKVEVMSEQTAYMVTNMLVTGGSSGVGGSINVSGTEVAAKGGTTTMDSSARKALGLPDSVTPDHWNNTYTADYSISLWYGYDKLEKGGSYITSTPGGKARRGIMAAVANKIYKKNSKFTKPSGVVSVTVEKETIPAALPSENTPDDMKMTALYKSGTEPTEVSTRYATLDNPTNGSYTQSGNTINITWTAIKTPEAIDQNSLATYFNTGYGQWADKYYQKRLEYNASYIGSIGYEVYVNNNGNLTYLGYTTSNSFSYNGDGITNYEFVIKSAYSIFKTNRSSGLTIKTKYTTPTVSQDTTTTQTNP